jgi:hypothetical protein
MNITDILDKFLIQLNKKGVSVKHDSFVQGRKAYNAHSAAEDFLGLLGEDEAMSYELVKKAKEKLEQANKKESFIPSASTIPELYTHTSESGATTFWLKKDNSNIYILLSHDISSLNSLIDAIIRLMNNETRDKLIRIANTLNQQEETDKHSLTTLVGETIKTNREHKINALEEAPKTFTTDINTPARTFFDLSKVPVIPKETPAWDSFTSRMVIEDTTLKGSDYFKAFIWSIFEEKDENRVFLYWYDEGKQGKSEAINILDKYILKNAFVSFDFFKLNSHSAESLIDKRLVVQHEAVVKKLSAIPLVKQITGGDSVVINPKGRKQYSLHIDAKIIVLSNSSPIVSSQGSELSRLLPIKNLPRKEEHFIPFFKEKLKEEIFDFLTKCRETYYSLMKSKQDSNFLSIEQELSTAETFLDYAGQLIEILIETYEIRSSFKGEYGTSWKKVQKVINKIIEEDDSLKGNVSASTPQILDFLQKWARRHGGKFVRVGGNKGFVGCVLVKKETETTQETMEEI